MLAGRDPWGVASLAGSFGLEWTTARMDEPACLRSIAASASVVLNAAGPFRATAPPLIDVCIETGAHYLDLTGDASVIEAAAALHETALHSGVMVMPAAGFEVVASDCIAAHVARRLPSAVELKLAFDKSAPMSRGSVKSVLEKYGQGVLVRRNGTLERIAQGSLSQAFDFGSGPQESLAVNLADVSTAFRSTGIPNIETYLRTTLPMWGAVSADRCWGPLLATPPWQVLLKAQTDLFFVDPSPQQRDAGWAVIVAEAKDAEGRIARSRLCTGDVYWFSAMSAVGVAEKCLGGQFAAGFQTPSRVYGADFALSFEKVFREDLSE